MTTPHPSLPPALSKCRLSDAHRLYHPHTGFLFEIHRWDATTVIVAPPHEKQTVTVSRTVVDKFLVPVRCKQIRD